MAWDKYKVRNPFMRKALNDVFTGAESITAIDATTLDGDTLKIAGTAITKSAAEINALTNTPWDYILDNSDTPVNAVASVGTLDVTGVALDSETLTIDGTDIYEFAADAAQSVTSGNIAVDITSYTTASAGELTIDTQPTSGKVLVIGSKTFTWVPDGTKVCGSRYRNVA